MRIRRGTNRPWRPPAWRSPSRSCAQPELARRGRIEIVVRRDERHAAAIEVRSEQAREVALAFVVERGERLVEEPTRRGIEPQAREADAPPLPCRKPARGKMAPRVEA